MRATERAARWFRRGGLRRIGHYGLLVALSTLYLMPFLWLVMTSVKVDREFYTRDPLSPPLSPNAFARSPFVDTEFYRGRTTKLQREWQGVAAEAVAARQFPFPRASAPNLPNSRWRWGCSPKPKPCCQPRHGPRAATPSGGSSTASPRRRCSTISFRRSTAA